MPRFSGLVLVQLYSRARDAAFSRLAGSGFHSFHRTARLAVPVRLVGAEKISVGAHVYVGSGSMLMVPVDDAPSPAIVIGARTRMHQAAVSAVQSVIIEESVDIARGCYISDHSHGFQLRDVPVRDQPLERIAPVRICAGAWLGQNVVVLPGVTIGAGSVIGANSVVRDDIPPRSIAVGAPARVIRTID